MQKSRKMLGSIIMVVLITALQMTFVYAEDLSNSKQAQDMIQDMKSRQTDINTNSFSVNDITSMNSETMSEQELKERGIKNEGATVAYIMKLIATLLAVLVIPFAILVATIIIIVKNVKAKKKEQQED